ncbi:MAG TPA: cyclopropane-fatty-acyl-phospholipid synthase family protein, partial [Deinococcales bacterium]|nr:cyclopropane-fatty-acyl-phospholipid synthase family protein [Deinococcales bacterium]
LDIGCGWGGLLVFAAERYGVTGVGVTLSESQADLARQRVLERGLSDRLEIRVRDYRDLPAEGQFDKIVSVGMFEHVGRANLPAHFAQAFGLLKPGGLFLNHGIVHPRPDPKRGLLSSAWLTASRPYTSFMDRYVFPGGELVTPGVVLEDAEAAGFETRDLESLREHYAITLRHWVRNLEARREEAETLVGEETYRVWRLYMAAVTRSFTTGLNGLVQVLFSKPLADGRTLLPATREDLYRPRGTPGGVEERREEVPAG